MDIERTKFREVRLVELPLLPNRLRKRLYGRKVVLSTSLSASECNLRLVQSSSTENGLQYMEGVYGRIETQGFALASFRSAAKRNLFAPVAYGHYQPAAWGMTNVVIRFAPPGTLILFVSGLVLLMSLFYTFFLVSALMGNVPLIPLVGGAIGLLGLFRGALSYIKNRPSETDEDRDILIFLIQTLEGQVVSREANT
jgi:hypothetical protein